MTPRTRRSRALIMLASTGMALCCAELLGLQDDWWRGRAAVLGCMVGGLV